MRLHPVLGRGLGDDVAQPGALRDAFAVERHADIMFPRLDMQHPCDRDTFGADHEGAVAVPVGGGGAGLCGIRPVLPVGGLVQNEQEKHRFEDLHQPEEQQHPPVESDKACSTAQGGGDPVADDDARQGGEDADQREGDRQIGPAARKG